jgi:hypothetical protein
VQPRVRHRFQQDRVGLTLSPQRLVVEAGVLSFDLEEDLGRPVQLALGALYAAGSLPERLRTPVFEAVRAGLVWGRDVDTRFISHIMNGRKVDPAQHPVWHDPVTWAREVLGLEGDGDGHPDERQVQRRFRSLLRDVHPDHGGVTVEAAGRIAELTEARRILLA